MEKKKKSYDVSILIWHHLIIAFDLLFLKFLEPRQPNPQDR